MRKLTTLTAVVALAVAFGYGGAAFADEFADAVDSFAYPAGDDCPTAGGFCDTSGDDDDQGLDARFADNGAAGDNTTFTSLGFNSDTNLGGVLVLNFDNNLCFDDPGGADLTVYEIDGTHGGGGAAESYDVSVGLQGATLTGAGNHNGTQDIESPVAFFNQIEIEATNDAGGTTAGADIDAVECLSTLDADDITKFFADNPRDDGNADEIDVREKGENDPATDQQFKAFTITIANNTGIVGTGASSAFNGLTFFDAVPAEYDLDDGALGGEDAATGGGSGGVTNVDELDAADGNVDGDCDDPLNNGNVVLCSGVDEQDAFDTGDCSGTDGLCDGNFADSICDDGSCNGIEEDPNGKCTVTADIPNGAKTGHGNEKLRSKLEPELLSINANGLSDGEECTTTVYVKTDLGHKKMFTPTSCPVDLNSGVKVFDSTMNLLLQDDSFLIFDDGDPRPEAEGQDPNFADDGICNDVEDD